MTTPITAISLDKICSEQTIKIFLFYACIKLLDALCIQQYMYTFWNRPYCISDVSKSFLTPWKYLHGVSVFHVLCMRRLFVCYTLHVWRAIYCCQNSGSLPSCSMWYKISLNECWTCASSTASLIYRKDEDEHYLVLFFERSPLFNGQSHNIKNFLKVFLWQIPELSLKGMFKDRFRFLSNSSQKIAKFTLGTIYLILLMIHQYSVRVIRKGRKSTPGW